MSQKSKKKRTAASTPSGAAPHGSPAVIPARRESPLEMAVEDFEPRADSTPMPGWLFVLMIVLAYWAMLHLDRYAGGFSEMVYGPYESSKQVADLQPKSGAEMLVAKGESVYGMVCIACHQSSGLGSPGQYPPLAGSEWAQGPANRVIRIPVHGLTGTIQVKGQTWTGLSMPAFGGAPPLDSDENLAAVLTFVRQAWGNKGTPITPDQVKAVRAETASRTTPWTPEELLKVPE
jgi:mono/diheme cytochrome c family protein